MKNMHLHTIFAHAPRIILLAALTSLFAKYSAFAQTNTAGSLADQLKTYYNVTVNGDQTSSKILVVQQAGIVGTPPDNPVALTATWHDNRMHSPKASALVFGNGKTKPIAVGEKVILAKVEVNFKSERVVLLVAECDACNGGNPSSYKSFVVFQFPKGYLEAADVGQVTDVMGQVFTISTGDSRQIEDHPSTPEPSTPGSSGPASQVSAPGLTNDDVLKMVEAQLPESVIVAKIKTSNCRFDTSPDALASLKKAGVGELTLKAMVEAPTGGTGTSDNGPTPAP